MRRRLNSFWPFTPRVPRCYKPADDFIFSEEDQDLFADETGMRFSQIKFNNTSRGEPARVFEKLAPKTTAAVTPHIQKMNDLVNKALEKESGNFCELVVERTFSLIMEISHMADRPQAYDEAVAMVNKEIAAAYAKLPIQSRQIIDKFFCIRRTPVNRTGYVTQIVSWYKYMV
ncbi:hypothetical protein PFISCL1PPCAC_22525 [Pristionchus fissidentatus]|uniref:Ribosomal protein n=1 Tax=Pristionchus fissidentatus TaxID=1538716 RepID=A0AAV5WLS8_9BILA|nr:hypothetical protein PFISCL1PPCAC_22525 [Pristionchus fissidentatus]